VGTARSEGRLGTVGTVRPQSPKNSQAQLGIAPTGATKRRHQVQGEANVIVPEAAKTPSDWVEVGQE